MVTTAGLIDAGDYAALAAQCKTEGISPGWLGKAWALIGSDDADGALSSSSN
jgi:hypothetical protein